jgi:hypothetical protein
MSFSVYNTWEVGHKFECTTSYDVTVSTVNGIIVRCLTKVEDTTPCAVIYHIQNHGDWILFDNSVKKEDRIGIPRVLNDLNIDIEPRLFINAKKVAQTIMYQIQTINV